MFILTTIQTILDNYFYRLHNFKEIVRNCYNCRLSSYISANWLFIDDNTDNLRQLFYIDCVTLKKLSEIVIIVVYHSTCQPIDCLLTTIQTILDNYFYRLRNFKEIVVSKQHLTLLLFISIKRFTSHRGDSIIGWIKQISLQNTWFWRKIHQYTSFRSY